jgi:phosphoserine phosphatase SerB
MARTAFGIDVGNHTVKVVGARLHKGIVQVVDFAAVPRDDHAARTLSAMGLKSVVAGLTGRDMNLRYSQVPPAPDWQLRNLMELEIQDLAAQSGGALATDYNLLQAADAQSGMDTVLLALARESALSERSQLIEAEVIDELARIAGVGEQVSAITERAMRGEIDFSESFRARMALLQGLSEDALEQVASELKITEGAEHLLATLRALGYKTAILSGGFTYFARYLQTRLGIDYIYANELDIADGVVTGKVVGRIVDGVRKAELLRQLAAEQNIDLQQVIAVGDGANDLPMLSVAGLGIAFRAKPLSSSRLSSRYQLLAWTRFYTFWACRIATRRK